MLSEMSIAIFLYSNNLYNIGISVYSLDVFSFIYYMHDENRNLGSNAISTIEDESFGQLFHLNSL